nr:MAG TPA: hypothetical protein [Caudoviricetes sp.]
MKKSKNTCLFSGLTIHKYEHSCYNKDMENKQTQMKGRTL